jgi:hypothetical protein
VGQADGDEDTEETFGSLSNRAESGEPVRGQLAKLTADRNNRRQDEAGYAEDCLKAIKKLHRCTSE